jgi:hypothetical protein
MPRFFSGFTKMLIHSNHQPVLAKIVYFIPKSAILRNQHSLDLKISGYSLTSRPGLSADVCLHVTLKK